MESRSEVGASAVPGPSGRKRTRPEDAEEEERRREIPSTPPPFLGFTSAPFNFVIANVDSPLNNTKSLDQKELVSDDLDVEINEQLIELWQGHEIGERHWKEKLLDVLLGGRQLPKSMEKELFAFTHSLWIYSKTRSESFRTLSETDQKLPIDLNSTTARSLRIVRKFGWAPGHQIYNDGDPLLRHRVLGQGAFGVVEEVQVKVQPPLETFVRKRVQIPPSNAKMTLLRLQQEVEVLEKVEHKHIVKIIGTYEEVGFLNRRFYHLLMEPVGDSDLESLLAMASDPAYKKPEWDSWIRQWFVCLASALAYVHSQGIRHEDIKPSNIIHRGSQIYFTDFGSSSKLKLGSNTTSTSSPAHATPRYKAPELFKTDEYGVPHSHGRSADVFALGCVYCEMVTVYQGSSVPRFQEFLGRTDPDRPVLYSKVSDMMKHWLLPHDRHFQGFLPWFDVIVPMLDVDRKARPVMADVVKEFSRKGLFGDCSCFQLFGNTVIG